MVVNKRKTKKSTKALQVSKKKEQPKAVPIVQNKEVSIPIIQIAQMLNVPSFEFFMIKKEYNIGDADLFTISQFKEMYKKTIEGR